MTATPDLPTLSPHLDAVRRHVIEHSVKRGDFTLKSGKPSSWFLDTKQTACRPDGIVAVADAMLDIIPSDATAIGGLTMGADPVAFTVAVFDAAGRRVRLLQQGTATPGWHTVSWDGRDDRGRSAPAGSYWYRLVTPEGTSTRRMLRLR